jgi:LPXTG-motif cell wall-anchored protein
VPPVTVPAVTAPASPVPAPFAPAAAPVTTPVGGLPATGGQIGGTARVGALLLLVGGAVVILTRGRRRAPSD